MFHKFGFAADFLASIAPPGNHTRQVWAACDGLRIEQLWFNCKGIYGYKVLIFVILGD